ncbi:ATP synthase F1 subunit gamma [Patescibacteria group bacterium]|nr:MAG: ATP synthase F1 subunit gamma [Patescibacteria group bacterium]
MAVPVRVIRRRVKSVSSTKKITGAMELVAASKMRRATSRALSSRRYAAAGVEMAESLAAGGELTHPLFLSRPVKKVLLVLTTSHRGLAGGFNGNVIKACFDFIGGKPGLEFSFATVGRKGEEALRRSGRKIVASFLSGGDTPSFADATPIADFCRSEFFAGAADQIFLAYTEFVSAVNQKPIVRRLLPIQMSEAASKPAGGASEIIFEPSRQEIYDAVLPKMVDLQVYQALLESAASEHSARMVAMKNATDAAREMIDDLTLTLNQARQSAITREISEIAASKAALGAG